MSGSHKAQALALMEKESECLYRAAAAALQKLRQEHLQFKASPAKSETLSQKNKMVN